MPFIEHRGGGRAKRDPARMQALWDAEWEHPLKIGTPDLSSPDWKLIAPLVTANGRVLEAGCGLAQWVSFLHDRGIETYGIDFSTAAIRRSHSARPDLKLMLGDLRHLPFSENSFDIVLSFGAVEHDPAGPFSALSEMFRVLRHHGTLYCTVPCYNFVRRMGVLAVQDWIVCNPAIRRLTGRSSDVAFFEYVYRPDEYRAVLSEAGFTDIRLKPTTCMELIAGRYPRSWRHRLAGELARRYPWCIPHMMAGICRKPADGEALQKSSGFAR